MRRSVRGPEYKIQTEFIQFLRERGWWVERMIGNAFQQGIPDLYVFHPKHGARWIDIKNPDRYEFTKAQRKKWPLWDKVGIGVWIIAACTEEEYNKLFRSPNWRHYWKDRYDEEIQELKGAMDDLFEEDSA